MRTLAVVNEKGGTGKTTVAVNLAAALSERKRRVLLVDLDGQAHASRWLGVVGDERLARALRTGQAARPVVGTIGAVDLLPGCGALDAIAHELRATQGGQLRRVLSHLAGGYEYALIDCPPSLANRLIGNALLAADAALVPVETSIMALDGLQRLLDTLADVQADLGHEIALCGVLACRYDCRTRLSADVLAELRRALPGKVFRTVIRESVRLRECPSSGQSILTFDPRGHGAEDFRALAREVERRL